MELSDQERELVLMALWNYRLATRQLHAEHAEAEALPTAFLLSDFVDALASKFGGKPELPLYGLELPPTPED